MKVTITIEDDGTVTTDTGTESVRRTSDAGETNGVRAAEPAAMDAGGPPDALLAMAEEVAAGTRAMPGLA